MKFKIKVMKMNLYVGSYWKTGCMLQDFAHSNSFNTRAEAEKVAEHLRHINGLELLVV